MRITLKRVILFIIESLEKWEYKNLQLDEDDVSKKILETHQTEDYLIETDSGFQPISHVHLTQPYKVWKLKTQSGKSIECADNHKLFNNQMNEVFVKDIKPGTFIQTKDGLEKVVDVQQTRNKTAMFDLTVDHPDHRYYTNGILSHNTVTSSIFIAWYLCFHFDRNALIVANKQATTSEIVNKVKTVLKNLPFFLRPGVVGGGVTGLSFDNGCRLLSQATTKTAAIGFTIHLLFADEFAHIHANFLTSFYRSVYPTLSSSKVSRIIICSTPNGLNLFHKIYKGAIEKNNAYHPIRVDWWEVPGRDEFWRSQEVANLGSEELFQQEYGNKFLATSTTLLESRTLEFLARVQTGFVYKDIFNTSILDDDYRFLEWHPNFDPNQNWKDSDKFIVSVDIADGVGRDYTVFNIFKLEVMSPAQIKRKKSFNEEPDFFRLRQVGLYHSNTESIERVVPVLDMLIFDVFGVENINVVMEMNFKGNYLVEKIAKNAEYYPELFLHTTHTLKATSLSLGVKLNKDNKQTYCRELKTLMRDKRIVTFEEKTLEELQSFGINEKGQFSGRGSADDIAMSCVNLVNYFDSSDFYEHVESIIDSVDQRSKNIIYKKFEDSSNDSDHLDTIKWFGSQ